MTERTLLAKFTEGGAVRAAEFGLHGQAAAFLVLPSDLALALRELFPELLDRA